MSLSTLIILIVAVCYVCFTVWITAHTVSKLNPMYTLATMILCLPISLDALANGLYSMATHGINWRNGLMFAAGLLFGIATGYIFKPIVLAIKANSKSNKHPQTATGATMGTTTVTVTLKDGPSNATGSDKQSKYC